MNVRFIGGPLDRTVVYLAPRPERIAADGGGAYLFDGDGTYRFDPELAAVEPEPAEEIRPARRTRTRRRA